MILSAKKQSATQRILLFGAPKTGKTELVGKLAEKYNLLWFDLENGYSTLFKLPQPWHERIQLISIPDTRTFPIAIETMLKVITGQKLSICEEHGKVNCALCIKNNAAVNIVELNNLSNNTIVVIDSLTQLSNSAIAHITKGQDELYKHTWQDFRDQGTLLDKFLSQVQQAKFNIVCITHEIESETEDGKKKIFPITGTREFSRNTPKYFDHVVYCNISNKKHNFGSSTTYINNVITGSRLGIEIEASSSEPDLLKFFSLDNIAVYNEAKAVENVTKAADLQQKLDVLRKKT